MKLLSDYKKRDLKKKLLMVRLLLCQTVEQKSALLKKSGVFGAMGDRCYWQPIKLPANPEHVFLGKNIVVATEVYFCTHDLLRYVFGSDTSLRRKQAADSFSYGDIVVEDNVFIGAGACIMYGVRIGHNSVIAARAVVTKDVPPGTIVAGSPAKVIGNYYALAEKRGWERQKAMD